MPGLALSRSGARFKPGGVPRNRPKSYRAKLMAATSDDKRQWYSLQDAANYLGISELNVRNLYRNGILPYHTRRGITGVWFKSDDLDKISAWAIREDDR